MTFALAAISVVLLVALAVAVHALRQARAQSGFTRLVGERVVVQVTDGRAISCVLAEVHRDSYSLKHPAILQPGQQAQDLGGEMLIPAERVSLVQVSAGDDQR